MIELYAFATPNSVKVPIMLEEVGADYHLTKVNVRAGEQKTPEFLALNPNGKVPVIVDPQGPHGTPVTITESAAILIYLAEKFGKLIPSDPIRRISMFEWMFFHASGLGPAFGQSGYFQKAAPIALPLAIERFSGEAKRTLAVLDQRLRAVEYLAEEFSIADIVNFGWIWRREFAGVDFSETPNVARWYASLEQRNSVVSAIAKLTALA